MYTNKTDRFPQHPHRPLPEHVDPSPESELTEDAVSSSETPVTTDDSTHTADTFDAQPESAQEQPAEHKQKTLLGRTAAILAAVLLAAILLFSFGMEFLFPNGNGIADVDFEYNLVYDGPVLDAEDKVVALYAHDAVTEDAYIVELPNNLKITTPTGRVGARKLSVGTLLFVSVPEGGCVANMTPPHLLPDVIMAKSVG